MNVTTNNAEALRALDRLEMNRYLGRCEADAFAQRVNDFVTVRDALLSRLTGEGWQPIETAPKDGVGILVWDGDGSAPYVAYRGEDYPDDAASDMHGIACYPTHWMPLPAPPALAPAPKETT